MIKSVNASSYNNPATPKKTPRCLSEFIQPHSAFGEKNSEKVSLIEGWRIKLHVPPIVSNPANISIEFHICIRTIQAERSWRRSEFRVWTNQVSNLFCYPHFSESMNVYL